MIHSIGDIIQIDYKKDGTYNHSTIVTGFQQNISGSGNSFTPKVTSRSGADSEHWATVIGKRNGEYTIIDPWDGKEHPLSEMQIYKNGGSVIGYAVVSNKY